MSKQFFANIVFVVFLLTACNSPAPTLAPVPPTATSARSATATSTIVPTPYRDSDANRATDCNSYANTDSQRNWNFLSTATQ